MTTNEIEKQLKNRAQEQIAKCVRDVVDELKGFSHTHTGRNRSGLQWYSKRQKPQQRFEGEEVRDPFVHYDWTELGQLIRRNREHNLLDSMVEKKAKELLNKIDLFE